MIQQRYLFTFPGLVGWWSKGTAPEGGGQANNPLVEGCPWLMLLLGVACPPASLPPGIGTATVPGIGTARPKLGTTIS